VRVKIYDENRAGFERRADLKVRPYIIANALFSFSPVARYYL